MRQYSSGRPLLIFLLSAMSISLNGCAAQPSQPSLVSVIASSGRPSGWLADGSQLLVEPLTGKPFFVSIDGSSFQSVTIPDIPDDLGSCVRISLDGNSMLFVKAVQSEVGQERYQLNHWNISNRTLSVLLVADLVKCPAWSPDSQHIVVAMREGDDCVLRILDSSETQERRDILPGFCFPDDLQWSPNGQMIAFSDGTSINIVDTNTEHLVDTGGFPRKGTHPTWSPDGQYIAYIAEQVSQRGDGNIVVVKLDGTLKMSVAQPDNASLLYREPIWSPRGDYIAARMIGSTVDHVASDLYQVVLVPVSNEFRADAVP